MLDLPNFHDGETAWALAQATQALGVWRKERKSCPKFCLRYQEIEDKDKAAETIGDGCEAQIGTTKYKITPFPRMLEPEHAAQTFTDIFLWNVERITMYDDGNTCSAIVDAKVGPPKNKLVLQVEGEPPLECSIYNMETGEDPEAAIQGVDNAWRRDSAQAQSPEDVIAAAKEEAFNKRSKATALGPSPFVRRSRPRGPRTPPPSGPPPSGDDTMRTPS